MAKLRWAVWWAMLLVAPLHAGPEGDAPKKIALSYLKALDGSGDPRARELLLGGVTLSAEDVKVTKWRIVDRIVEIEEHDVRGAIAAMNALDESGRRALNQLMQLAEEATDVAITSVDQQTADQLMRPTQTASQDFKSKYPVFAYCARAGKEVYWHPANPWRHVVRQLKPEDDYRLELHRFTIEEGSASSKRAWPLRVLRITSGAYDSGWKILPASDWNPDW
ncbi:MAG: hypothetical protein ACO3JL_03610 [Myxococcota bacterium]